MTTAPQADQTAPVDEARRSWRDRLPAATPAILGYIAVRAVGLVVLWLLARHDGADFWGLLSGRFDSVWNIRIVQDGYDAAIPVTASGAPRPSNLAFFPIYPALMWWLHAVTSLPVAASGLLVSWVSGAVAAWGIYAVGARVRSHTTGVVLAVLWGAVPHAVVQNMVYSETLFTALVAWCLYALLAGRWLTAGVLCMFAGLTRPNSATLIAALGITMLVAIRREGGWRPWVAGAIAPLGHVAYLAWVGDRVGRWDGYFYMQREGWNNALSTTRNLGIVERLLTEPRQPTAFYITLILLGTAVALVALQAIDRFPLPVVLYSAISVVFVILAGAYEGKGRYLVPVFTLLLPIAAALAAAKTSTKVVVLTFVACLSAWYGTYLTLAWTYSP